MQAEARISKNICALIRRRGGWARKIAGGPRSSGLPDIISVYRRIPLMLETKVPGREKTLTKLQAKTLKETADAGAISRVVISTDQVSKLLDAIDRRLDK